MTEAMVTESGAIYLHEYSLVPPLCGFSVEYCVVC